MPRRLGFRYPHRAYPVVRDFDTVDALVEHAYQTEHPTHVLVSGTDVRIYYPAGLGKYAESKVWSKGGYWHQQAPGDRRDVVGLPRGAEPIDAYLSRGIGRGHTVRDYVPVDNRGRPLSGPTKDYEKAKRQAEQAGGYVKFDTGRPPVMESLGRGRAWPDWEILDAIDRGIGLPPESERRLTAKGRQTVERQVPVAAEARRGGRHESSGRRGGRANPASIAADLSGKFHGGTPLSVPGGFRWSEPNESAQFTVHSPEHGQKLVVVVSVFEDGSAALNFFSDEGLSGTDTYENVGHQTYPGTGRADVREMEKDVGWALKTIDGYAASWQQDQPEVDERPSRKHR